MNYDEYIKSKQQIQDDFGIEVAQSKIPDILFPHQKDVVNWSLKRGRALLALSFGLGKTLIQASLARIAQSESGQKTLTVCPLGVRGEFMCNSKSVNGQKLHPVDIGVEYQYVTSDSEIYNAKTPYLITNYERVRDGNIDPRKHNLCFATFDEGAYFRSLGSKTYHQFELLFNEVPLRYICTATPSPNQYRELIYYANILGIVDNGLSLTRWFGRDVNRAGNLQLLPQFENEFWLWVSTWAMFLYRPGDLGYDDTGYELPELNVHWHRLPVDYMRAWKETDNRNQFKLLPDASGSAIDAFREKRDTLQSRLDKAKEIIAEYDANECEDNNGILLWHHMEYERNEIKRQIPESVIVYGSQKLEEREESILGFTNGEFRILAPKPLIAGSGCNFQHWSHRNIFLGIDYKFADFIQAIHRTHRFLQKYPVDVHIIYAESEDKIAQTLKQKWERHNNLVAKMQGIIRKYGLSRKALEEDVVRTIGVSRKEEKRTLFTAVNNDCVQEVKQIKSNSIDLTFTSVPFGNHFEYTDKVEDFGYNPSDSDFWRQMDYLTPELLRVNKPGRKALIHVKDRILYSHQVDHGLTSVSPFSDECVMHFIKHGWVYEGRRTIVTDVVRENNSTYRLGYTEMSKDSTKMGSGLPEYLLCFRKPNTDSTKQYSDTRVTKFKVYNDNLTNEQGEFIGNELLYQCGNCGHIAKFEDLEYLEGDRIYQKMQCPNCKKNQVFYTRGQWQLDASSFWQSNGNAIVTQELYDNVKHWQEMDSMDRKGTLSSSFLQIPPKAKSDMVWDDIVFMRCLNSEQNRKKLTNHICPLPLDIVKRGIILYSDIGDTVLDPFAGLFTVPVQSIELGRKAYGIELNQSYYKDGLFYCEQAEDKKLAPTIFDLLNLSY